MRKLDDIIPPSRRRDMDVPPADASGGPREPLRLRERPTRFPFVATIIILAVIAVSVGALFYFSNAEVKVTPASATASVQTTMSATKSSGALPFEIITAQKIATQSVSGSGTKTVSTKATGTLTVYNTQAKPQKLVATTRFATASGLIFRIPTAVTVPAGSTAKPGSISVKVVADQAGDSYNVGPSSFTLPGLAGTALASAVYARSTAPMTGGASGTVPVVDPSTESTAVTALKQALAPDLSSAIQSQVPEGYVLVPGATETDYTELTPAPSSTTGMVDIKEQGTVTAVIFPTGALAAAIASSTPGMSYQGEPVTLTSSSGLTLTPVGGMPSASDTSFSFTLTGTAGITYTVDPLRIASAVAGKSRSAAEVALTNYPEVSKAIIVLRPFWRGSFPEDPSSVKVVVDSASAQN